MVGRMGWGVFVGCVSRLFRKLGGAESGNGRDS